MILRQRKGFGLLEAVLAFSLLAVFLGPALGLLQFSQRKNVWERGRILLAGELRRHQLSVLNQSWGILTKAARDQTLLPTLTPEELSHTGVEILSSESKIRTVGPGLIEVRSRITWVSSRGKTRVTETVRLRARRTRTLERDLVEGDPS